MMVTPGILVSPLELHDAGTGRVYSGLRQSVTPVSTTARESA